MMRWLMLICVCVALSAESELVWENATQQRSVTGELGDISFVYSFRNTGGDPIEILKVHKGCGCLQEQLDRAQPIYAPGESGALTVTLDLNNRFGHIKKALMVETSDPLSRPQSLRLEVVAPESYHLFPRYLMWKGGAAAAKTCRFLNTSSEPVVLASAKSLSTEFSVELIPIREGFEYDVIVQPTSESSPLVSEIVIATSAPRSGEKPREYRFGIRVFALER